MLSNYSQGQGNHEASAAAAATDEYQQGTVAKAYLAQKRQPRRWADLHSCYVAVEGEDTSVSQHGEAPQDSNLSYVCVGGGEGTSCSASCEGTLSTTISVGNHGKRHGEAHASMSDKACSELSSSYIDKCNSNSSNSNIEAHAFETVRKLIAGQATLAEFSLIEVVEQMHTHMFSNSVHAQVASQLHNQLSGRCL